jgi:hypothetical protein
MIAFSDMVQVGDLQRAEAAPRLAGHADAAAVPGLRCDH